MATGNTQAGRNGNGGWRRVAWLAPLVVVGVLLLAGLGLAPLHARAANYPCTEAGLNSAIATGGNATFGCGSATTVTITDAKTISTNVTLDGGGLLTISGDSSYQVFVVNSGIAFTVQNLTIANAYGGGIGGGILNNGGKVTVTNSTLRGNVAASGGGLYNNAGSVTITGSLIGGNKAIDGGGGGLYNFNGTMAVVNSTLSDNNRGGTAAFYGGAIDINNGTVTVINSTISGNVALFGGGGINNAGTLNLTNSLVVNNTTRYGGSSDLSGNALSVNSHNRTGAFTFVGGSTTVPGNYSGPTATFALLASSPAIDAGVCLPTYTDPGTGAIVTVTTDQRGVSRPQGAGCDIGAFESLGVHLTQMGNNQSAAVTAAFAQPLTVTVTSNDPGVGASGIPITFTAPTSGASGTFAGGTSATVNTDTNGVATSSTFTANTVAGSYTVTATGGGGTATFTLTNTAGAAASISVVSGSNQTAQIGAVFAVPLTVRVFDAHGNPVPNITVTFAVPTGNVPTATFDHNGIVTTDASGYASLPFTAAGRPGVFTATATVNGASTSFTLTDTAAPGTLTLTGFAPPTGPTAGGNSITITGTNLNGATSATVGGANTPITAHTATSVTVTAPAHAAGTVDITVTTGGPPQTATIHGYTYLDTGNIAVQPGLHPLPGGGTGGGGVPAPAPARHADAGGGTQPQAAPAAPAGAGAGASASALTATPNAQPGRH